MITDWLLNKIRDAVYDGVSTIGSDISHIAIGTGESGEASGDIELETEYLRKAIESIERGDKSITLYAVLDTTEGNTVIKEIGAFDDASGGNMAARKHMDIEITKTNSVEMKIIFVITFGSE